MNTHKSCEHREHGGRDQSQVKVKKKFEKIKSVPIKTYQKVMTMTVSLLSIFPLSVDTQYPVLSVDPLSL